MEGYLIHSWGRFRGGASRTLQIGVQGQGLHSWVGGGCGQGGASQALLGRDVASPWALADSVPLLQWADP